MKKNYLFAVLCLFLVVMSCAKEDTGNEIDVNAAEEIALNPDEVSAGILIENGTLVPGNAPSPTGTLAFNLEETTESGFQKSGFDITFNAPDNYAGAYIQLKAEDGTMAESYWNVSNQKSSNKTTRKKRKQLGSLKKSNLKVDDEVLIDVNFEDSVSAGTFCYFICIYDSDGNISQPTEVCVEVEAWGGNDDLVGIWNFTKFVTNNETTTVDSENCDEYEYTIYCSNGSELVIQNDYCNTIVSLIMTFNEDGTYEYTNTNKHSELDYDLTQQNCVTTLKDPEDEIYISKGFWAFDEEESELTLVEFEYTETYNGMTNSGTEENGELVFSAGASISSNTLILTIEEDFDDTDIKIEYYFSK